MKYILFWMAIFMYSMSGNLQAAEHATIPCYIVNETWAVKTMLTGTISYGKKRIEEISLLVEGTTIDSERIEHLINLPLGRITEFNLILSYCHEETDTCNMDATVASSLLFKPRIPLKEISLELVPMEISTHPVYNLPPKFQDK
ncbi:MAG: hypothetical protein ACOH2E_01150 [Candidatus Paracaedibacter sp.]